MALKIEARESIRNFIIAVMGVLKDSTITFSQLGCSNHRVGR